jgi:hypothetical protein
VSLRGLESNDLIRAWQQQASLILPPENTGILPARGGLPGPAFFPRAAVSRIHPLQAMGKAWREGKTGWQSSRDTAELANNRAGEQFLCFAWRLFSSLLVRYPWRA